MAKKSLNRRMRDYNDGELQKHLENNKSWDELEELHSEMATMLMQHANLGAVLNNKELIAALKDKSAFAEKVRILGRDLGVMANELNEIYAQHKGKTGGITDPDQIFLPITIFEQYTLFSERHEGVIMPVVQMILEDVHQAEQRLAGAKQIIAEQDAVAAQADKDPAKVVEGEVLPADNAKSSEENPPEATGFRIEAESVQHESVTKPDFAKLTESFNAIHGTQIPVDKAPQASTQQEASKE